MPCRRLVVVVVVVCSPVATNSDQSSDTSFLPRAVVHCTSLGCCCCRGRGRVRVVSLLFFLCHCVASGMDTENTTVRRSARQISRPRTPLARVAPAVPALGSSGVVGSARGREQFASALAAAANRSLDAAKASLSLSPSKATVSRAVSDSTRTLPAPAPAIGAFVLSLTSNDVASRRCRCS